MASIQEKEKAKSKSVQVTSSIGNLHRSWEEQYHLRLEAADSSPSADRPPHPPWLFFFFFFFFVVVFANPNLSFTVQNTLQQRWPSSLLDTARQSVNGPLVLSLALYSPDPTVFLWSKNLILFSDTLKITRFITRERQCQSQGTGAMNGPVVLSLALYSPDPTVFLWSKTVILLSDTLKRTRLITREHQCQSQGTRYRERTAGSFTRAFFSRSHSFPTVRNSS
jgi:hypothetical protein